MKKNVGDLRLHSHGNDPLIVPDNSFFIFWRHVSVVVLKLILHTCPRLNNSYENHKNAALLTV
jgi:hypothetical protein